MMKAKSQIFGGYLAIDLARSKTTFTWRLRDVATVLRRQLHSTLVK